MLGCYLHKGFNDNKKILSFTALWSNVNTFEKHQLNNRNFFFSHSSFCFVPLLQIIRKCTDLVLFAYFFFVSFNFQKHVL